jgi:hypothetical protein
MIPTLPCGVFFLQEALDFGFWRASCKTTLQDTIDFVVILNTKTPRHEGAEFRGSESSTSRENEASRIECRHLYFCADIAALGLRVLALKFFTPSEAGVSLLQEDLNP